MGCSHRQSLRMQCGTSFVQIDSDATFSLLKEAIWLRGHEMEHNEVTICISQTPPQLNDK